MLLAEKLKVQKVGGRDRVNTGGSFEIRLDYFWVGGWSGDDDGYSAFYIVGIEVEAGAAHLFYMASESGIRINFYRNAFLWLSSIYLKLSSI